MVEKERGGDSSPVHLEGIEMMANAFHKTNALAKKYTEKRLAIYESILNRKCQDVLEVGCGPGVFYKPWQSANVSWTGIDINPYWKEFGQQNQIPISNYPIDSIKDQYDVIMAYQVIEHVEDPVSFMKGIIARLKPGGIVHLELPNQNALTSKLRRISSQFSYDYGFIQPPMHLRAFRKKTICRLFKDFNLESKLVLTCGNTDKIWGQVRDYNLLQKSLYRLAGMFGLGSLLIGVAQKGDSID
ncbi:MAG: class I SAM-dependent methyltransferase [Candidatus Marinimicrobia bacterium]|nr:class I SAM-dependent methyltransferase [Candidatus Neomarinimicrobiota bacterium]